MKRISMIDNERGMVLVVALLFLTLLSVLGATGIMTSTTDMKIASANRSATKALYIAEGGMARAEAELINDLNNDQDLSNTSFNATTGTITITPSSTSFYTPTGFSNISFADGSYTIQLKNYPTNPQDDSTIWARSIGTGPNSSTVTVERYLSAENISPWNNAIFSDGGGAVPITGNVVIAGSIHILGDGLLATDTVFSNQTGDCRNTNVGMDSDLADAIDGGTTSDLNAKFRIKNGRVDMSVGSADIGSSSSPFKGIYVTDGDDADADGVNDDIIGGDNAGAGQNLYADEGATSSEAYDLGDYDITMPSIDTVWLDANSLDLTGTTEVDGWGTGLNNGTLELTGKHKEGPTWYYPNINQSDANGSIFFDSTTNVLTISGVVKVSSFTISDDITYAGNGTIYTTGTTLIDGNVLPTAAASYPTTNVFGVVSTGQAVAQSQFSDSN